MESKVATPRMDASFSGESMFTSSDREHAQDAGARLYNILASLGVELDDIDVIPPCKDCGRTDYRISLGNYYVDVVEKMAEKLESIAQSPSASPSTDQEGGQHA